MPTTPAITDTGTPALLPMYPRAIAGKPNVRPYGKYKTAQTHGCGAERSAAMCDGSYETLLTSDRRQALPKNVSENSKRAPIRSAIVLSAADAPTTIDLESDTR